MAEILLFRRDTAMIANYDALEAVAVWLQANKKGNPATGVEPALRLWNAKSITAALHALGSTHAIVVFDLSRRTSPRFRGNLLTNFSPMFNRTNYPSI